MLSDLRFELGTLILSIYLFQPAGYIVLCMGYN